MATRWRTSCASAYTPTVASLSATGRSSCGGLGLLIPQFFGGRTVPGASMACGCVAPEERGGQLAGELIAERLRPLQDQGAVVATLWTASTGYVRRLGWEAPTQVYSWTVPADELRHSFREPDFKIIHETTEQCRTLCNDLAARWNGPWQRPDWWETWQERQHPGMATYAFNLPGQEPSGVLSVAGERHPTEGPQLVVYDFWAGDQAVAAAMLAFLGRRQQPHLYRRLPADRPAARTAADAPPSPFRLPHRTCLAPVDAAHPGPAPGGAAARLARRCGSHPPDRSRRRGRQGHGPVHPPDRGRGG